MPEGDVLRLTAERLDAALAGHVLTRAELRWPSAAAANLVGATVLGTAAYGKHLLTRFDDGRTLHTHLRMEGWWRVDRTGSQGAAARGTTVRAVLATRSWTCTGRRLGMLDLLATRDERRVLAGLGPDVLADDFAPHAPASRLPDGVARLLREPGRPLCDALLDQRGVAGLGTIWTAESLFACRLYPWDPVGSLDEDEIARLLLTARNLMWRSIRVARRDGFGAVGSAVHGRAGRACRRCGTPVAVGTANEQPFERPVFWCPTCQAATG
ncbi:Fpg/Nei family DNA glycosylase [Myceligenerans indicum]|uniref:DNA-(apurinic or apyrimidinic site) lyase n=1 Tax=Myceligenerans indicum TaxID=2593663 RepID=A0ABS1LJU7_9MICO|nr:Fpg/Nei family DNA glycosylase [Myceligenerans indicum]MBL0886520.1 Fpg/Nei family DNA glycosylase [Myceligenerans indicum]